MLLSSGFDDPHGMPDDDGHSMQALHDAILEALLNGGLLSDETLEKMFGQDWKDSDDAEARLDQLIQQIIQKLQNQGYVTASPDLDGERQRREGAGGGAGQAETKLKFEITDKSLDFLGYRALRDLLGSIGKSSLGPPRYARDGDGRRGQRRAEAVRIRRHDEPRRQRHDPERGDALGSDLRAVRSRSGSRPASQRRGRCERSIDINYEDLMVAQGEYQSSCATVLMLDCSHSMILYGEDRFTPAKRVALALANLIRLQYPGDALKVVLFHDSAEEIPLTQLGAGERRPLLHEYPRRPAPGEAHPRTAAEGHAPDRDDHRRQAVGADAAGRPHLPQRLRTRSVHRLRDDR